MNRPQPLNPLKAIVDSIASARQEQPGEAASGRPFGRDVNPMNAYTPAEPPPEPSVPPAQVEGSFGVGLHTLRHVNPMESQK